MATKKGFLDLPAEMRNQIYENYVSTFPERPLIKPQKLDKSTRKTMFTLVMTLGLRQNFPLIFTRKQIMQEVLAYCLGTFALHLRDRDQLEVVRNLQHLSNFNNIEASVRELSLDLSWLGQGIVDPQSHSTRTAVATRALLPLPCPYTTHMFAYTTSGVRVLPGLLSPQPSNPFWKLFAELAQYFPNVKSICIELDKWTICLQADLRKCLVDASWPSLRQVRVRRPDLELCLTPPAERDVLFPGRRHQLVFRPPQRIPWKVEMEFLFLEEVNDNLAQIMCTRLS